MRCQRLSACCTRLRKARTLRTPHTSPAMLASGKLKSTQRAATSGATRVTSRLHVKYGLCVSCTTDRETNSFLAATGCLFSVTGALAQQETYRGRGGGGGVGGLCRRCNTFVGTSVQFLQHSKVSVLATWRCGRRHATTNKSQGLRYQHGLHPQLQVLCMCSRCKFYALLVGRNT